VNNYRETLLAQYANSPTITGIIERFNDCIDPSVDLDQFFEMIWNIETAQGIGLDFWGKVVDISRQLQIDQELDYFGYDEAFTGTGSNIQPFNQAPFYNGPLATQTYTLSDDAYRKLIMLKAMSNVSDCTAPSMNRLLNFIFGNSGRCFVQDVGDMQMRFVFEFDLTAVEKAILTRSNAIARPTGVQLTIIIQLDTSATFGFAEAGLQPFDQGVFFSEGGIIHAS